MRLTVDNTHCFIELQMLSIIFDACNHFIYLRFICRAYHNQGRIQVIVGGRLAKPPGSFCVSNTQVLLQFRKNTRAKKSVGLLHFQMS